MFLPYFGPDLIMDITQVVKIKSTMETLLLFALHNSTEPGTLPSLWSSMLQTLYNCNSVSGYAQL